MAANTVASATNAAKKAVVNAFSSTNFSISGASGLYHRARPTYPEESIEKIVSILPNTGAKVIEVGAGTGLFTEALLRSKQIAGSGRVASLTAVEPSEGMREGFRKSQLLSEYSGADKKPHVKVVDGSFGDLPAETASIDLVVGAQCFHWAHPEYAAAAAEFARVLKPGGTLAFIWNLEDKETDWVAKNRSAYESYEKGTPQYRLGWWRAVFDTVEYQNNFEPAEQADFRIAHPTTDQGVVDRVFSKSYITAQPEEEKQKIDARIKQILAEARDKVWIDESQGVFEYPYVTSLFLMRRKAA